MNEDVNATFQLCEHTNYTTYYEVNIINIASNFYSKTISMRHINICISTILKSNMVQIFKCFLITRVLIENGTYMAYESQYLNSDNMKMHTCNAFT
jgi:hypothetical protein